MTIHTAFRFSFAVCFLCLLAYFGLPAKVLATGEFKASYDVQYAVAPSGVTIVTQNVTLVNQFTNLYPKQYQISIDSERIQNVIARDDGGVITPAITQKDGKTDIVLTFNQQIVGIGKKQSFTLRYEHLDITQKNGSIWEVTIPGIADDPDIDAYYVTLEVPPTFGANAFTSPIPADGRRWNRDQMARGGISAAYGLLQHAKLQLSYYLENPKLTPAFSEIALPPDTPYQKITIDAIDPKPTSVRRDEDGNWLVRFDLVPGQKLEVKAQVSVTMSLESRTDPPAEDIQIRDSYLRALPYWEADNDKILALAATYTTPRQIYDYVVTTLAYDYNRATQNPVRKGAVAALLSPKESVCMEFTDLFIAIARAAGIPARQLVGYAHTTNPKLRPLSLISDVLHAWPEYFDKDRNVWVPIDPTWGNTTNGVNYFDKLDFNHIVFAINGMSSSTPYPAGFYRKPGQKGKDVLVEFIDASPVPATPPDSLEVSIQFPQKVTAGFTANGTVTIENKSGTAVESATVLIQATPLSYSVTQTEHDIPPFTKITIPITVSVPGSTTGNKGRLAVTVNGQLTNYFFDIQPLYWLYLALFGMVGSSLFLLSYALTHVSTWNIFRKHS
ncbi:MAG: hypothetical protein UY10_C0021G0002 [Microgenomates group bacterium GW2011_GWA2_47_8]|nr:MAG: hypothetical protein UY10_C0021G0002 [Microgenomates group bacterium GW2011_GWA2_47_8]